MDELQIIKIGGNVIDHTEKLQAFLMDFAELTGPKILVHGGGKEATSLAKKMGIPVKMIEGRRITDQANLDLVTMIYAGKINKSIVAQLQNYSCNALGLSGADASSYTAIKRAVEEIDYGFVGDLKTINTPFFKNLIDLGISPVCCAISHDAHGQLLNTNADTVAAGLATALSEQYEVVLNYCFDKKGVLQNIEDEHSVIPEINFELYRQLKLEGVIAEGMLPKLHNCFQALKNGVKEVRIGNPMILSTEKQFTKIIY